MAAILSAETDREAWLAARRNGIGASEIAALLGISPWESPFSLYHRKRNGWEIEATESMSAGTILEPAIAAWGADRIDPNHNQVCVPGKLMARNDRPWQMATPDRTIHEVCGDCDGDGAGGANAALPGYGSLCCSCYASGIGGPPWAVLECKWTGSWDGWGDEESDDVPVYYRAQVLWQCDVVGVDDWFIAVLGPSGFRLYRGRSDAKDIAVMVEAGRRFMHRLEVGDPPPIDDHHATLTTLKRLHPDLTDETVEVDQAVASGYLRAVTMCRKADALKDRYEAKLREQMGSAHRATSGGAFVASRSIFDVAETVRKGYTVDRLNPPRSKK